MCLNIIEIVFFSRGVSNLPPFCIASFIIGWSCLEKGIILFEVEGRGKEVVRGMQKADLEESIEVGLSGKDALVQSVFFMSMRLPLC